MARETIGGVRDAGGPIGARPRDQRLEDVEFEMPLAVGEGDDGAIADHLRADHAERFDLGRIDLARHDRGAGLVLRQTQFPEPRPRSRPQQSNVARDLEQRRGQSDVRAPCVNAMRVMRGDRLKFVGRRDERKLREFGDLAGEQFSESRMRVEPGADGGGALGKREAGRPSSLRRGPARVRPAPRKPRIPVPDGSAWRPADGCGRS